MTTGEQIVVIISTAAPEQAPGIAQALVRDRIVACVNILPVRSVYRWKGEICDDQECLLIMKTAKRNAGRAVAAVRKLHSYEIPEVIVLPVTEGYPPYLEWVLQETAVQ